MPDTKRTLWLVDDSEIIRIYFREVIWIHGLESKYNLLCLKSIDELKARLRGGEAPDVLFLNLINQPNEAGKVSSAEESLAILRMIKADAKLKKTKVVIFSTVYDDELLARARKLGADAFLMKNENLPADLLKVVETI